MTRRGQVAWLATMCLLGCTPPVVAPDADLDGTPDASDCAPDDPTIHPAATELPADGIDQDCDGLEACFTDDDRDGWGSTSTPSADLTCAAEGLTTSPGDCDDASADVSPDGREVCNGRDDDCNGLIDDAPDLPTWAFDRDDDGVADLTTTFDACFAPPGFIAPTALQDCDDLDPLAWPGAPEIPADGVDQDCNGVDDCYPDLDTDGFGVGPAVPGTTLDCSADTESTHDDDCDDTTALFSPVAPERCGLLDHDCDGIAGNDDPDVRTLPTWYADTDTDGFGNPGAPTRACLMPAGTVPNATDCNDADPQTHPDADERCDSYDNDCDGAIDDADDDVVQAPVWHRDRDRDTYGHPTDTRTMCLPSGEYDTLDGTDCIDLWAFVNPGRNDSVGNTLDEDCNGALSCYTDVDGDGAAGSRPGDVVGTTCDVPGFSSTISDCDDDDPEIQRFTYWADLDNDTYGNPNSALIACVPPAFFATRAGDCDDTRADVYPGAIEQPGDERDGDCDGTELCWTDADGDTFGGMLSQPSPDLSCRAPGESRRSDDCHDGDPSIHPGAPERIGDGVDADCDGTELCFVDQDGDHWGVPIVAPVLGLSCDGPGVAPELGDCDDAAPERHPTAPETCASGDNDCDGLTGDADPDVADAPAWWPDADGDGLGDSTAPPQRACAAPPAHVSDATDCDDTRAAWGLTCPYEAVHVGQAGACAVRTDGTPDCQGTVDLALAPPDLDRVRDLDVADSLACALDVTGAVRCWGALPDARAVAPGGAFRHIALGSGTACALDEAGVATCWGSDAAGLVSGAPVQAGFTALTVGDDLACAVDEGGLAVCWGDDACGAGLTMADAVQAATGASCALTGGVLTCAGCGSVPAQAPSVPLLRFLDVDVAPEAACAITVTGDPTCWGGAARPPPPLHGPAHTIGVGPDDACAVLDDGFIQCWGASGLF